MPACLSGGMEGPRALWRSLERCVFEEQVGAVCRFQGFQIQFAGFRVSRSSLQGVRKFVTNFVGESVPGVSMC